jgi:hypothetical protein
MFIIKQILENRLEFYLIYLFVDYEKAFDRMKDIEYFAEERIFTTFIKDNTQSVRRNTVVGLINVKNNL